MLSELNDLLEKKDFDSFVKRISEIGQEKMLNPFAMRDLYEFCRENLDKLEGYYRAKVLMYLGNIAYVLRKLEDADKYYDESLSLFLELAKKDYSYIKDAVYVLINRGTLAFDLRRYDDAEKHYISALDILRDIGSEEEIATVLNNLGVLFTATKRFKDAKKVLKEAVEIRTELANKDKKYLNDLIESLNNYGVLLKSEKDFEEAEKVFEKVLEISKDPGALLNIASIKLEKGEYSEAKDILDKLLKQNLPPYIRVKVLVAYAYANEKTGELLDAGEKYLLAASISYLVMRQYNLSNLNFVAWLDKAMIYGDRETKEIAKAIMRGLEKLFYNAEPDVRSINEDIPTARLIKKALTEGILEDISPKDEVETAAYLIAKDIVEQSAGNKV
ncbi:hypothetical protein DRN97_07335 [Methanosarcinales archaeon]|nr:MAG: hypothetical protein DRN97_07335 [Methanosarcinales archaeon]